VNGARIEHVRYRFPGVVLDPELEREFAEKWRMTREEDRAVTARVQAGLRSGLYQWGYTMPESEPPRLSASC
jgi:hypothetical protein